MLKDGPTNRRGDGATTGSEAGPVPLTLPGILAALRSRRADLEAMGLTRVGVYGSYLHGRQRPNSDIDIIIDHDEGFTLFDLVRVGDYLEALLGREVDLLEVSAARRRSFLAIIVDEAAYAY